MSLINDALKKAQRQRGDSTPPEPAAPVAPMPGPISATPSRRAAQGAKPQLYLLGAGALLGLGLALGAVFLLREPAPAPVAAKVEPASASAPATATVAPSTSPEKATSPTAAPLTVSAPAPAAAEPALITVSTRPADPTPAQPEAAASETARPAAGPAPKPSLRMINAIEAYRIAGVRASGADSKVLMNDRVFRIGDTVDHELAIRITAVTANSISFVDDTGATYTRNF